MRDDFGFLARWIAPQSRVLDLGCGDGTLLSQLAASRQVRGYGLEIDPVSIQACIERGVNVIEQDLNNSLDNFTDQSFDTVVMTQALQAMRYPHLVLDEMLRIGRECIVTFPNFGQWRARAYLTLRGRMPVTEQLAYQWYDTPNIHFFTYRDFEQLCAERGIAVIHRKRIATGWPDRWLTAALPNLFTETAIYHLSRQA